MIFLWYSQITEFPFDRGIHFIYNTFSSLNNFFVIESRGPEVSQAIGTSNVSFLSQKIKFVVYWSTIALMLMGILVTVIKFKDMASLSDSRLIKSPFMESMIGIEYLVLTFICLFMLVLSVVLPYILVGYNLSRLYFMLTIVLAMFFTVSGISISNFLKKGFCYNGLITIFVLLLFFICSSSAIDKILNEPGSIILSSDGKDYNTYYIYDQDICTLKWYSEYGELKDDLYLDIPASDIFGSYISPPNLVNRKLLPLTSKNIHDSYIFLRYYNSVYGELIDSSYRPYSISECKNTFSSKNLIYTSGGSELWK